MFLYWNLNISVSVRMHSPGVERYSIFNYGYLW